MNLRLGHARMSALRGAGALLLMLAAPGNHGYRILPGPWRLAVGLAGLLLVGIDVARHGVWGPMPDVDPDDNTLTTLDLSNPADRSKG